MAPRRKAKPLNSVAEVTANQALRARGMLPLRWAGSATRLRAHGVEVETHQDAVVRDQGHSIPGRLNTTDLETMSLWAPRWAVLVVEAEPCNEQAVEWALARARDDEDFRASLDTIGAMAFEDAKRKMADFVMELWEPEPSTP